MKPKKFAATSILVLIILLLATLMLVKGTFSEEVEKCVFYSLDYGGLLVEIEAPTIAWPGDEVNITIRAGTSAKIHIASIEVNVSSLREGRDEVPLLTDDNVLRDADLDPRMLNEATFGIAIPEDA